LSTALNCSCERLLRKLARKGVSKLKALRNPIHTIVQRLLFAAAGCMLVGACASTIKEGMVKFEGQPLSAAIAKIGVPNDERTVAGKKVYIWGSAGEKESKEKGCQIRATMNGDAIESFDYEGDEKLCQRYAPRLRP
jgi:hypothetical protein